MCERSSTLSEELTKDQYRLTLLPFAQVTLISERPLPFGRSFRTLGRHLLKRRYERGLYPRHVAEELGVNEWTYSSWELDQAFPRIWMMPHLIGFIGHYPFEAPRTPGEELLARRQCLSLSRGELAKQLCVHERTLQKWEHRAKQPPAEIV